MGYGQTGVDGRRRPAAAELPAGAAPGRRSATLPGGEGGIGHGLTDLTSSTCSTSRASQHGSACGGDSGSPVFLGDTNQLVAVHTGGFRLGSTGAICGRMSSLNHRLDTAVALDWITGFLD